MHYDMLSLPQGQQKEEETMTASFSPAFKRAFSRLKPSRPPVSEREYQRILESVGEQVPHRGRPKRGSSRVSYIHHVRLSARTEKALKKFARDRHIRPNRAIQFVMAHHLLEM